MRNRADNGHFPSPPAGEGGATAPDEGCAQGIAFALKRENNDITTDYTLRPTPHPAFGHLLPQGEKERAQSPLEGIA